MDHLRGCECAALVGLMAPLLHCVVAQGPAPVRQFHVAEFGARSGSGADAGPGIRAAIAAAVASGAPAEVVLDEGVYRVGRDPDDSCALAIAQARGLTVRGQGASTEIVITDPELGGFRLTQCKGTTITDLAIDYSPPPYSQSTVVAVDLEAQTFDVIPEEGFLKPDDKAFGNAKAAWGLVVREGTGDAPTHFGPTAIPAVLERRLSEERWRMKVGGPATGYPDALRSSGMAPGDRFVHLARNYAAAVGASGCDDLRLEGITLYSSPGLAFCPYLCGSVVIRNCHVRRRPGAGRLLSTNADGVHCRGARNGILIEGCSFEGMADDGINIHSSPIPVLEVVSSTELIVRKFHYTLQVGDRVEAMDAEAARVRGQAIVVGMEDMPERWAYRVRLDRPVEGLRTGSGLEDADNLYNLSECATGSVIRDCHFGSFRGRGVLLSCIGATVSGNQFEVTEGWGVWLYHESTRWAEGPLPRDIEIVGNAFNGRGGYQPAIGVHPTRRDGKLADARVIGNVVIRDNVFAELGVPAVELHSCRGVRIVDNTVETSEDAKRPRRSYASLVVDNCEGVDVSALTVSDTDPRHVAAVLISATTAAGAAGISVRGLSVELAHTSVPVRDERR